MAQTGSMIAFIVLVVIVVFGVMLYAYLTVVNQAKESQAAIDQFVGNHSSKHHATSNFSVFAKLVNQNQPAEVILPLGELNAAKDQLETMLIKSDPTGRLADLVDANLVAECDKCSLRVPASDFHTLSGEVCSTPNCGSTKYAMRWIPSNSDEEDLPTAGE